MAQKQEGPKFLLLEAIMDLIDKKIGPEKLKMKLEDSRKSLQEIKEDFEANFNQLAPRVKEGVSTEVQVVHKIFGDWENAFKSIEEFFITGQNFDLIRAGDTVRRCSDALNRAFDDFRLQALLVMGPTDIPNLNQIINVIADVKAAPEAPLDNLKVVTATELIVSEGAIRELEFDRKNRAAFMEQELLIKAYKELQEAMRNIETFIKDGNKELLDKGLEQAKIVYPKIKELIPLVNYKRMIQKPTASPSANLLINMSTALVNGAVSDEMFFQTLKEGEDEFNQVKIKFEALTRQETDSVLVKEEMQRALEGLKLYGDAIRDYKAFTECREALFIDQANREIAQAVEILDKAYNMFQDVADREGKTPCIRCGHYNQPTRKTCEKCGAILPKAADMTTASTFDVTVNEQVVSLESEIPMPENIEKLFLAVNQVSEQEISVEDFELAVRDFHELMEANRAAGFAPIPHVNIDKLKGEEKETAEKLLETMQEVKQLFEEGYRDFEEGLDFFYDYMQQGDKNLLVEGVKTIWEGNKKFHRLDQLTEGLERDKTKV